MNFLSLSLSPCSCVLGFVWPVVCADGAVTRRIGFGPTAGVHLVAPGRHPAAAPRRDGRDGGDERQREVAVRLESLVGGRRACGWREGEGAAASCCAEGYHGDVAAGFGMFVLGLGKCFWVVLILCDLGQSKTVDDDVLCWLGFTPDAIITSCKTGMYLE